MKTLVSCTLCLGLLGAVLVAGCQPSDSGRPQLAFVTNNPSDFWKFARAGIRKAEKEFGVDVEFLTPGDGTAGRQRTLIETEIARGKQGMAVSVLDPKGAIDLLNEAAKKMHVVTQDSDCPESNRRAYIGTNNVDAGRVAGEEIVKALPEGGNVVLFVGKLDVANARERRQGIIEATKDHGVKILETFTDEGDRPRAQQNVRNALNKYQDVDALVGLWEYNPPAIIRVVKEKKLEGKIKIVGFDENDATLQAIEDGVVESTVVQQPYEFGYQSIRTLSRLIRNEDPEIPANGLLYIPVKVINKSNVKEFRKSVAEMLAEG